MGLSWFSGSLLRLKAWSDMDDSLCISDQNHCILEPAAPIFIMRYAISRLHLWRGRSRTLGCTPAWFSWTAQIAASRFLLVLCVELSTPISTCMLEHVAVVAFGRSHCVVLIPPVTPVSGMPRWAHTQAADNTIITAVPGSTTKLWGHQLILYSRVKHLIHRLFRVSTYMGLTIEFWFPFWVFY